MSYNIYLLKKEVKEQGLGLEVLEKEELVAPFTAEQFETVLLHEKKWIDFSQLFKIIKQPFF